MRWVWLGWLGLTTSAFAGEVCTTPDTTGWTTRQLALREATAYRLAFEAGQNLVPRMRGDSICFENPTFDVPTVITAPLLLSKMTQLASEETARLAALPNPDVELDAAIASAMTLEELKKALRGQTRQGRVKAERP